MRKSLTLAASAVAIALPSFAFAQDFAPQQFVTAPVNSAVAIAGDAVALPGMLLTGRSSAYGYDSGYGYYGEHATKPNSLEMHPSGPNAQDEGY